MHSTFQGQKILFRCAGHMTIRTLEPCPIAKSTCNGSASWADSMASSGICEKVSNSCDPPLKVSLHAERRAQLCCGLAACTTLGNLCIHESI